MADAARPRSTAIAALLCVQALAAAFFLADAVGDLRGGEWSAHALIETLIAAGLAAGVVMNARQLRAMLSSTARAEAAMQAASGAMAELIDARCAEWRLTPAEADVARLAIKGFGAEEIARLRAAAAGTVRAQLTRVYAKAGVGSRAELVSLLIEDLLAGPIAPAADLRRVPAPAPPLAARPAR